MKRETQLTKNNAAIVYNFVDTGKFGDCIQDKYISKLTNFLSIEYAASAMQMPMIACDIKGYLFTENYRTIIDALNPDKNIYVYFDHPIPEAALYLGTFDRRMKYPLLKALEEMNTNYQTTPISIMPLTVKIDMFSFRDKKCVRKEIGQSLEYLHDIDNIIHPNQLFDVLETRLKSR